MTSINVAAVQMRAKLGAVDENLSQAQVLAEEGFRRGAEWVILPEFFTSAVAFAPSMQNAWQPIDGPALGMMRRLARKHDGVVGGSFLARDGDDCFNAFCLVFPDGRCYRHDKDIPTLWEHCYYVGGNDDGVFETSAGTVGAAVCWELIRTQTVRRLKGRVGVVVSGSCWWDFPLPVQERHVDQQQHLLNMLREAPALMAQMLGVPVVHASHAGDFDAFVPGSEGRGYRSRYLGQTQIVSGHGEVLARMACEDGEGVVTAEVQLGHNVQPSVEIPQGFWTVEPPATTLNLMEPMRLAGQAHYARVVRPSLHTR